jgi:hypothetical protein
VAQSLSFLPPKNFHFLPNFCLKSFSTQTQNYFLRDDYINEPYTTSNQNKEFYLNEVYGSSHLIDPSKWTYSFNSYLMHLYVSSHGQGPSLIYTGGRGLYVPGANWLKTY